MRTAGNTTLTRIAIFGLLAAFAFVVGYFGVPGGSRDPAAPQPPPQGDAQEPAEEAAHREAPPADTGDVSPRERAAADDPASPAGGPEAAASPVSNDGPGRRPEDSAPEGRVFADPDYSLGAQENWEGAEIVSDDPDAGEPAGMDPLGTGAVVGQLSPTERRRVEAAAAGFVAAAHGFWGEGAEARREYEGTAATLIADPARFYGTPAGEAVASTAETIREDGLYAEAQLLSFAALEEGEERVLALVRFEERRMLEEPVVREQELVLVRPEGMPEGWRVAGGSAPEGPSPVGP